MRNVKKSWLCVKIVNKSFFYVGPILKVISLLTNDNMIIYNYSRDTSDDIIKVLTKLSKLYSCMDLYYCCRLHWLTLG